MCIDNLNEAVDKIILHNELETNNELIENSTLSLIYGQKANYYIRMKSPQLAYDNCNEGLKYNNKCIVCISNINVCMRQLGMINEAIKLTWNLLNIQHEFVLSNNLRNTINNDYNNNDNKHYHITVFCVKWGTKYNSDYVNYLYRDINDNINSCENNTIITWTMICFTEDSRGISSNITCLPFPGDTKSWSGWWLKTAIFQHKVEFNNDNDSIIRLSLYLDLDICICGSLSFFIDLYNNNSNDNVFYTLGAEHLKSEGRLCGINSSLILWKSNCFGWNIIYDFLVLHYSSLIAGIYKFDHYLEMMLLDEMKVSRNLNSNIIY